MAPSLVLCAVLCAVLCVGAAAVSPVTLTTPLTQTSTVMGFTTTLTPTTTPTPPPSTTTPTPPPSTTPLTQTSTVTVTGLFPTPPPTPTPTPPTPTTTATPLTQTTTPITPTTTATPPPITGNRFPPTTTPITTPTTPLSNTPITGTGIFTTPTPTTITTTPTSTSPLRNTSSLMQVFTINYSTPAPPPQPTGNPSRPSPSQQMCPEGWEVFQGRCYYFVNQPLSWPEAQSNCALLESMLASVHSPQEYNFLQQFTNSNGNEEAWLGGFYLQYQWLWIDGSWFYNNSWNNASTDSSSPCLLLNSNEPWSNSPCNTFGTPGICVKNSNVPPAMACPEGWTVFQGRCYYYNEVSMSWPEADASCASLGASLVSVHSPQEYMFLLQQTFSPSWLGGFYIDDQWMWLDGSWFYEGFFGQTPPPSTYQCLSTFNPDGWSPYSCNQIMPSFCMKEALSYRH